MSEDKYRDVNKTRNKKRKLRWGRLVFILLLAAIILTIATWGIIWTYRIFNPPQVEPIAAEESILLDEKLNKRINVLLLGVDDGDSEASKDEPKRSDAIMLVSFSPEDDKVSLLSLPRDTKVKIPGIQGHDKLNSAFAHGGVPLAKQTVANLLKIPIHHYVLIDWQGFVEAIDLIGGVDLYVEKDMYYEDPYADLVIDIKHGFQHLDGKKSGQYVRFRKDELGDIGRVQRQQKFMRAVASQIFNISTITKIPALFNVANKNIQTDMSTLTMIRAANSFKLFGNEKVKTVMLYGDFDDTEGTSYWLTSDEEIKKSLDEIEIPYMKEEKGGES